MRRGCGVWRCGSSNVVVLDSAWFYYQLSYKFFSACQRSSAGFASRGQQRTAILALKLAEADWMRAEIGELPVVLLDDVLSELDPQRREYVLQRVAEPEPTQQRQVWITTTETTDLSASHSHEFFTTAQRFLIDAGRLRAA